MVDVMLSPKIHSTATTHTTNEHAALPWPHLAKGGRVSPAGLIKLEATIPMIRKELSLSCPGESE